MPIEQYVVIQSKERNFGAVRSLRNLMIFTAVTFVLATVAMIAMATLAAFRYFTVPDRWVSLISYIDASFFVFLSFITGASFLIYLIFAILLHVGIKNNWSWPVWIVTLFILLSSGLLIVFLTIIVLNIFMADDSHDLILALSVLVKLIWMNLLVNPIELVITLLICLGSLLHFIIAIAFSAKSIRNIFERAPDSVKYANGLIIEDAKESDIEDAVKIYVKQELLNNPDISKHSIVKKFSDKFDWNTELRLARVPGETVGFLLGSEQASRIDLIGSSEKFDEYQIEDSLIQDFVRRCTKAKGPVPVVRVSSENSNFQKVLLDNGWKATNGYFTHSTDMLFEYQGNL